MRTPIIPSYFLLLARHASLWFQHGSVMLNQSTEAAKEAHRLRLRNVQSQVLVLRNEAQHQGAVIDSRELSRLVGDYAYERLVISPAKLRSLFLLRQAKEYRAIVTALAGGYPLLVMQLD